MAINPSRKMYSKKDIEQIRTKLHQDKYTLAEIVGVLLFFAVVILAS